MLKTIAATLLALTATGAATAGDEGVRVVAASDAERGTALPLHVGGRVGTTAAGEVRQWPGTYFETAFRGPAAAFAVGPGDVALQVVVDSRTVGTLVKPKPGAYRIAGLAPGEHRLRVAVMSESQAGPTTFGGFFAGAGTRVVPLVPRRRQIEFIGDSHTVGYGDTSAKRDCTQDEVWATTDTQRAFGPMLARRYGADFQVNAISGRGMVRNYGGFAADTVPEAYPYVLFDHGRRAEDPAWHPQVIVIALGTNDFTTPLKPGERWKTRADLHADFEATYVRFVRQLRARDPRALIVLWATDMADGEIEAEVAKVAATLRAGGDARLVYVPVDGLAFSACHAHPSLADETVIAGRLAKAIDARAGGWAPTARPNRDSAIGISPYRHNGHLER